MKNPRKKTQLIAALICGVGLMNSCKKDVALSEIDEELFNMARNTVNFTLFKNSTDLLNMSDGNAHTYPYLRTRYNDIASTQLDTTSRISENALFPEGSIIVKELYSNTTTIARYAVLYKNSSNVNADARGWVWGYINANGTVAETATNKGSACNGCHSQSGNIDYMLMNKYFE